MNDSCRSEHAAQGQHGRPLTPAAPLVTVSCRKCGSCTRFDSAWGLLFSPCCGGGKSRGSQTSQLFPNNCVLSFDLGGKT